MPSPGSRRGDFDWRFKSISHNWREWWRHSRGCSISRLTLCSPLIGPSGASQESEWSTVPLTLFLALFLSQAKKRGRYTKVMKKTLFIEIRENSDKIIFRERYTKKIENDREWDREKLSNKSFLGSMRKKKRFAKNREKKRKKRKKCIMKLSICEKGWVIVCVFGCLLW